MLESIVGTVLAHKQLIIAATVISGVIFYAGSVAIAPAFAQPRLIERNIQIHCLPYCQQAANILGDRVIEHINDVVHIRITFSFLPR